MMEQLHLCTKDCIHYRFCAHAYTKGGGMRCGDFMDKTHILYPKYCIGDPVWTILFDEQQQDIPVGVYKFSVCEVQWDGEEFCYYDYEYFLHEEHTLFDTKEEAEAFLKEYNEIEV